MSVFFCFYICTNIIYDRYLKIIEYQAYVSIYLCTQTKLVLLLSVCLNDVGKYGHILDAVTSSLMWKAKMTKI